MTPQEKKREQRLLKRYNQTLADYNQMAQEGCMICGRAGIKRSLNVDHCHRTARSKIHAIGSKKTGWNAWSEYEPMTNYATGQTRAEAVHKVRRLLLRASVRGVLCFHHNRGLAMFNDSPELLRKAAAYIERFENA